LDLPHFAPRGVGDLVAPVQGALQPVKVVSCVSLQFRDLVVIVGYDLDGLEIFANESFREW